MYRIILHHIKRIHEYEELIKIFLRPTEYVIENNGTLADQLKNLVAVGEGIHEDDVILSVPDELSRHFDTPAEKNAIKRYLYDQLCELKKMRPEWGIITGVRPVKLASELIRRVGETAAREILQTDYRLSREKTELLIRIDQKQQRCLPKAEQNAVAVYVGIPFCPTRCLYCSFPSNQAGAPQIAQYLNALLQEIVLVGEQMKKKGWYAESVYIGGGTPTTLSADQLAQLIDRIDRYFVSEHTAEFTVEAGRPDTITKDKLSVLKEKGVTRISINPQSMKEETLALIGRSHTPQDINKAFALAQEAKMPIVNADLIAGLPEEHVDDYLNTLTQVIKLAPQNITVHTMALKRASKLKETDADYHYKMGQRVRAMLSAGEKLLAEAGYEPYYLYRQKQMAGNFENVGYAKPHTEGIYNIRIMEEKQTIIACGAGGISKVYYAAEDRLERVPNVSNYEIYIKRLDEMCQRKEENIFTENR